jgi:CRISPR/Cas system-associated endonuclease Cas3-HD
MSNLIHGAGLIEKPFDKFWDNPPTRREMQAVFQKLGDNDAELMGMCDTAALVLNFLCEKLGVRREELEEYVKAKSTEVNAMREQMKAQLVSQGAQKNEQPAG